MLSTESLSRYCQSEHLSEEGLREFFERHGMTPNNNGPENVDEKVFFKLCFDGKITEGIIRCFLEYFPAAANFNKDGITPLHLVVNNERVSLNIVQLLVDAAPNSVRSVSAKGTMPLHHLCSGSEPGEASAGEIMKFLIEKYPEGVQHVDDYGRIPLHYACERRSPEFCRVLVEAYPGSEQIHVPSSNCLPFGIACLRNNNLATVEYIYNLYPDAIDHKLYPDANNHTISEHPIFYIVKDMYGRSNPMAGVEIVRFLLDHNPSLGAVVVAPDLNLIYCACTSLFMAADQSEVNSNTEACIQIIEMIYDAYPEAIEGSHIDSEIYLWNQRIQIFINSQLVYARQARDYSQMTTPDDNGQLPLHTALQNNVRLGSIKLLVKGNTTAVNSPDNNGLLPLHVACQHHDSTAVIQYLVGLDTSTLEAVDNDQNTALHHACCSAKYETIAMLLEEYDAVSISKQNADGKLPLDLLLESNEVVDRESIEYIESIFRLLRAYPETVMNYNVHENERGASALDDLLNT